MRPGAGEVPEYNTVDAALWFIEAWRAYVAATGDAALLAQVIVLYVLGRSGAPRMAATLTAPFLALALVAAAGAEIGDHHL